MLTTSDVGDLFQVMRNRYGAQWKHGPESIADWREALKRFSKNRIQAAADQSLKVHVKHPPTLPEFLQLVDPKSTAPPRADNYRQPPAMSHARRAANLCLMRVLIRSAGVDRGQMRTLKDMKNALIEDLGEDPVTGEWLADIQQQLADLAALHDPALKARELDSAREQFGIRMGISR